MAPNSLTGVLRETLALFDSPGAPRTTSEIADELDLGRRSTYDRLQRLVDQERLRTKKVGANARVWWRPSTDDDIDTEDGHHQFHSLVDAVEEYAIFLLDPDGNVKTWNHGARQIKGYTEAEIVDQHFSTFYTADDRADNVPERNLRAAAEAGKIEDEGWRVRADGSRFWANVSITAIHDGDGDLEGFAKVIRDMTERHEHDDQLRQERTFTQRILETAPVGVVLLDEDGTFTSANQWADELLGLSDDGPHALADNAVFDENGEPIPPSERPYMQVFDSGESIRNIQFNVPVGDSDRRWVAVNAEPLTADDGAVERVLVTIEDVTQLKHQTERLQRERDQASSELGDVFERVDDAFFAIDDEWRFTYVNDAAAAVVGLSPTEMLGSRVWDTLPEVAEGRPRAMAERAMTTGESAEFEFYSNLLKIWVEVRLYPAEDGLSVYFRDVTERKEREHDLERYETLAQTASDGIITIDTDSVIRDANPAVADVFGYEPSELVGESLTMLMPDRLANDHVTAIQRYLDEGEPNLDWDYVELPGVHADGTEIPLSLSFSEYEHAGDRYFTGIIRDITERKERERELELYETIVATMQDGVYVLDDDFEFVTVNDAYVEMTGYDREELLGTHCSLVVDDDVTAESALQLEEMLAGAADAGVIEADILRADGQKLRAESRFTALNGDGLQGSRKVGVVRDVSERVAREQELEESRQRYQTLVDSFPNGAVALVNEDLRYVTVGGMPLEVGVDSTADLEGAPLEAILSPELAELLIPRYEDGLAGETSSFEADLDDGSFQFQIVPVRDDDGEIFAALGMSQDITERKEYERQLEQRIRQQEAVTALGRQALETDDLDTLMAEAADLVADVLDNDYCKVLDLDPDAQELRLRQGVGWHDGIVGTATVSATENDSQAAYTLASAEPVRVNDLSTEERFSDPDLLTDHDVKSGISTIIGSVDDPWGTLGTHATEVTEFSQQDVDFVQSVANILAPAIRRQQDERRLRAQRERLAALNDFNQVVRELTTAAIEQSSRVEIERTVCEHLANSESYMFAWIGDIDTTTETVNLRTEAGVEGYLDDITISVDPDDERSQGPTGRALLTGEIQVTNDIQAADHHDPWREHIEQYGYESSAAIPIVHEDTVYGALNVYADRPDAFGGDEQNVIAQLGEIVGHAIAAAERKRALMSDELVELDFHMNGILDELGVSMPADERITLDHAVPRRDDGFLVYGTATPGAVDTVHEIVDTVDYWESVEFRDGDDPVGFELRMSDPPVLSTVASLGGHVKEAVVEDGDIDLRIHLAPSVDVRRVIDVVEAAYPTADMRRRRQITRSVADPQRMQRELLADLTEKQRATLEAAYHAGFFGWPRDTSGEELADSLGVASPTFHQHLRKAEAKIFDSLLSAETPS